MPPRSAALRLHLDRFPTRAVFDTAVSHAMLRRVAAGAAPESLRLYRPDDVMLFSSLDARRPGFGRAVEIAEEHGFETAIRLAGGHAAVFLEASMAFAWAMPDADARAGIRERFERVSGIVAEALRRLDLDARIGEIPGEYCPGEFSVNLAGRSKVMGVGQRVIRGGAHVGGVLTVGDSDRMRAVLARVYDALELDFQPETAGGVGELEPGLAVDDVIDSLRGVLEDAGLELRTARFDEATLEAAESLSPIHRADRPGSQEGGPIRVLGGKTLLHADRSLSRDASDPSED